MNKTKTIKDLYDKKVWEIDFSPEPSLAFAEGFESGANAVLKEIEGCYDKNDSLCVIAHKILSKIQELKVR